MKDHLEEVTALSDIEAPQQILLIFLMTFLFGLYHRCSAGRGNEVWDPLLGTRFRKEPLEIHTVLHKIPALIEVTHCYIENLFE